MDLGAALRTAQHADPAGIPDIVGSVATSLGATDVVVYLVDFAQATLEPLPDRRVHAELPASEAVATTMAGRAFTSQSVTSAPRRDGVRVWAPIVEGSDRTGVLALTFPAVDDDVARACQELGLFTGALIATQARFTDLYELHRRRRSLSLAASMQWDLLPPLVMKTDRMTVAGLLEPAYEIGGDCFDYALNHTVFDMAVVDAMGHGLQAAHLASLAVGSYRHDRREGRSLLHAHTTLDQTIAGQFEGSAFATGLLMRVDLDTGLLRLVNAGHPPPVLIRGGSVLGPLACPPALPWGLGDVGGGAAEAAITLEQLEPGDAVLAYTDGVIESRTPDGDEFGLDRLLDLATRHSSDLQEAEEIVRHLIGAVAEHQSEKLLDDATVVLFRWNG